MRKFKDCFKLIEEDWLRYPYKKLKKLYDIETSIKLHLYNGGAEVMAGGGGIYH